MVGADASGSRTARREHDLGAHDPRQRRELRGEAGTVVAIERALALDRAVDGRRARKARRAGRPGGDRGRARELRDRHAGTLPRARN